MYVWVAVRQRRARERVRPAKMNFFTDLALDKIFASELVGDEYECR